MHFLELGALTPQEQNDHVKNKRCTLRWEASSADNKEQSKSKISNDQSKFKKDASKEGIRGSMSIGHSVFIRVHSRKRIIEDQMKMGGDRPGGMIENEANERGV